MTNNFKELKMLTLKERMKINSERVKKSEDKKRAAGLVRVSVWVPADRADKFRAAAKIINNQAQIEALKNEVQVMEGGNNGENQR